MSRYFTWIDRLTARWPAAVRHRAWATGLAFGVVGFLVALVVAGYWSLAAFSGAGFDLVGALGVGLGLPLAAGLSAGAVGGPLWWKLVETPDEPTSLRGGGIGAAVGVLAHPRCGSCSAWGGSRWPPRPP